MASVLFCLRRMIRSTQASKAVPSEKAAMADIATWSAMKDKDVTHR